MMSSSWYYNTRDDSDNHSINAAFDGDTGDNRYDHSHNYNDNNTSQLLSQTMKSSHPLNNANDNTRNSDSNGLPEALKPDEPASTPPPPASPAILTSQNLNLNTPAPSSSDDPAPPDPFSDNPTILTLHQNFLMEHRIFLRAILSLLTSRDQFAVEANINSPPIKTGPLKKAATVLRGVWKTKYVEIRRGIFSYWEDGGSATVRRKSLPLRASVCVCRAVKMPSGMLNSRGAVFELIVDGGARRLWMASSKGERQAWIRAIHEGMIGGSVTRGTAFNVCEEDGIPLNSPFREDLECYTEIQKVIKEARDREEYLVALGKMIGKSLVVPVQWIKERVEVEGEKQFEEGGVALGVAQLWKDMLRDSVSINKIVFKGDAGHGPERIIGALTRQIKDYDKTFHTKKDKKCRISDLQAVAYARDILLACNRTRSGGDSYYCVDNLYSHSELVVLVPYSLEAEPLNVTVEHASEQDEAGLHEGNDHAGWARIRVSGKKQWRKRFCVLGDGVLSYYEKELPRPNGLRGQMVLSGASISVSMEQERPVLSIVSYDKLKERQLGFDDGQDLEIWKKSVLKAIESSTDSAGQQNGTTSQNIPDLSTLKRHFTDLKGKLSPPLLRQVKGLNIPTPGTNGLSPHPENTEANKLSANDVDIPTSDKKKPERARSTVRVRVHAATYYKICTTDPQGDDEEDTWGTLRTKFLQDFTLSGGPHGRIIRGEEVVQMDCFKGLADMASFE